MKAAKQGHALAQNAIGYCYNHEQGISQNKKKAVRWFRRSAEPGIDHAEYNFTEAAKWYRKAAEAGLADAQNNLGMCYKSYYGGVLTNYEEAVKWFQKAADQGHVEAQYNLAECYANGTGVIKNTHLAKVLFQKAAELGHVEAQYIIANQYYIINNCPEAVAWYHKAAIQGHLKAIIELGCCYEKGLGVTPCYKQAAKWFD